MNELTRLFGLGKLKPVVSRVYLLDEVPRALEDMAARRVVGKVVVDTTRWTAGGGSGGGGGGGGSYRGGARKAAAALSAISRL